MLRRRMEALRPLTQDGLSAHRGRLAQSETITVDNNIACPSSPMVALESMDPEHIVRTVVEIDCRRSRSEGHSSFTGLLLLRRDLLELVLLAAVQHLQMAGLACKRLLRDGCKAR